MTRKLLVEKIRWRCAGWKKSLVTRKCIFLEVIRKLTVGKYGGGGLVASYYQALGTRSRAEGAGGWGGGLAPVGFLSSWRSTGADPGLLLAQVGM